MIQEFKGIQGRITTKHLITHAITIIHEFGFLTYLKAIRISFTGGTFLECIR